MFCTTLRKRLEWASVPSTLLGVQDRTWRESNLETHDIAMPLSRADGKEHFTQLLLLSASDLGMRAKALARIERLYNFGERHVGIIFLLHEKDGEKEGFNAYMELQVSLLSSSIEMPIIPLHSLLSLQATLLTFQIQLLKAKPPPLIINPTTTILQYCSANPPMAEHTRNILSDICHTFRELSQAATTADGQEEIRKWVEAPAQAEDAIQFWLQEYIAD